MKLLIPAVIALMVLASGSASAAKAAPSGTLSIVEPGPYQLGQTIHFSWSATGLKKTQDPRIQLVCDQGGTVVYGEAKPAVMPTTEFTIGGFASPWLNEPQYRPNSSTCNAVLYYWQFHPAQVFVPISPVVTFTAAGLP